MKYSFVSPFVILFAVLALSPARASAAYKEFHFVSCEGGDLSMGYGRNVLLCYGPSAKGGNESQRYAIEATSVGLQINTTMDFGSVHCSINTDYYSDFSRPQTFGGVKGNLGMGAAGRALWVKQLSTGSSCYILSGSVGFGVGIAGVRLTISETNLP